VHQLGDAGAFLARHGCAGVAQVMEVQVRAPGQLARFAPAEALSEHLSGPFVDDGGPTVEGGLG
jgi:hypothetical protein